MGNHPPKKLRVLTHAAQPNVADPTTGDSVNPLERLLPRRQQRLIDLMKDPMNHGMSQERLARMVGVNRKTLYRWRLDPVFRAAYTAAGDTSLDLRKDAIDMMMATRQIDAALLRLAKSGNVSALTLYYQLTGYLT